MPWHRKASAKTQVSLRKFLQSEVKIIHIIVQVQDGQNNNITKVIAILTEDLLECFASCSIHKQNIVSDYKKARSFLSKMRIGVNWLTEGVETIH